MKTMHGRYWIALAALLTVVSCTKDEAVKAEATPTKPSSATARTDSSGTQTVSLAVTDRGFEPSRVHVAKHKRVKLVITRKTDKTCAKDVVIKEHNIRAALPLNEPVAVNFTPHESGELKYGCGMDQMISGVIMVH